MTRKKALDGPFDRVWAYACYLLPLAILELYFRAKDSTDSRLKVAMAGGLGAFTVLMAVGIVGVSRSCIDSCSADEAREFWLVASG